ncbi:hypothetical protein A9Q74_00665 [Colwellia sp. 39_35_sub15_T18]|nr:hypothetical protein A9Q74_00665 [Colwellia sp. 39_35_sub15_T18]
MAHILSAASVSFARGLNDTPKIAGLFVAVAMLNIQFGIPVSTTHVSVGSIFGASMLTEERNHKMINSILLLWVITLPSAMLFSRVIYWLLS